MYFGDVGYSFCLENCFPSTYSTCHAGVQPRSRGCGAARCIAEHKAAVAESGINLTLWRQLPRVPWIIVLCVWWFWVYRIIEVTLRGEMTKSCLTSYGQTAFPLPLMMRGFLQKTLDIEARCACPCLRDISETPDSPVQSAQSLQ